MLRDTLIDLIDSMARFSSHLRLSGDGFGWLYFWGWHNLEHLHRCFLCPTIFKAQNIACHNKLELETSMKYCSCFFWMLTSLYMVYKKKVSGSRKVTKKTFNSNISRFLFQAFLSGPFTTWKRSWSLSSKSFVTESMKFQNLACKETGQAQQKKVDMWKKDYIIKNQAGFHGSDFRVVFLLTKKYCDSDLHQLWASDPEWLQKRWLCNDGQMFRSIFRTGIQWVTNMLT